MLVFAQSLITLNYIEECLAYWSEQCPSSQWQKGVDYFRIDGQQLSTCRLLHSNKNEHSSHFAGKISMKQRAADIQLFNDINNTRSRLFLISTKAGGLGINLFSANRVIILDTSWNPGLFSMNIEQE